MICRRTNHHADTRATREAAAPEAWGYSMCLVPGVEGSRCFANIRKRFRRVAVPDSASDYSRRATADRLVRENLSAKMLRFSFGVCAATRPLWEVGIQFTLLRGVAAGISFTSQLRCPRPLMRDCH
jgi:hypothetical protein